MSNIKAVDADKLDRLFTGIGDAIRTKEGSSDLIPNTDMAQRILDLKGGSGGDYDVEFIDNEDGSQDIKIWDHNYRKIRLKVVESRTVESIGDAMKTPNMSHVMVAGSNYWWYIPFIRFEELPEIPAGAVIEKAALHLYCFYWNDNAVAATNAICAPLTDWDAESMTWNTMPTRTPADDGGYAKDGLFPAPDVGQWGEIDITDLVRGWIDGTIPNYGLTVESTNPQSSWRVNWHFYVNESIGHDAYIAVEYRLGG